MFTSKVESDKGQLEIVYDVQWKTPGNDDDKAKIIGIVDTPDTYLDWNTFKSYLIQNSGNMRFTTDDIRISYLDSDDDLIPVDNASEFRECLKFSRTRARRGRKIMMKVSLVSNGGAKPKNYSKHSGESSKNPKLFCLKKKDISTSIKKNGGVPIEKPQKNEKNEIDTNAVPIWFEAYMTKFKAELIEEITTAVVSNVRSVCGNTSAVKSRNTEPPQKEPHQYYPLQHMFEKRKKKKKMPEEDSSDCTDGLQLQWEERLELLRHMQKINKREKKFEKKLDAKLEKLESKTKKIMEKKHNLWGVKKSTGIPLPSHNLQTTEPVTATTATATATTSNCDNLIANQCMDAVPVDEYNFVPHVLRGETVHQVWKVVNNGQKQWTEDTELRFAWGSKSLVPLTTAVKCPLLKPGETGKIKVTLQAPLFPGHFESYWHFHHQGRRFGHWLGCAVIVDAEPRPVTPEQQQPQQQTIEPKTAAEIYQMQSQVQPETELETDAAPSSPVDLTMKTYIDILSFEGGDAFCQELDVKPELQPQPQMILEEPPQIEKLESAGLHLQAFLAAEPQKTPQYGLVLSKDSMNVLDYVNCMYFPEEDKHQNNIALDLKKRDSLERNNLDTDSYEKVLTQVENISIEENQKNEEKVTSENVSENNVNVNDPEYNSGSDSDNISILSDTISVDTDDSEPSEEFVVVPMPTCLDCEQEEQEQSIDNTELEQVQPQPQPEETPESDNNNNMEDLKPFPKMPQLSLPPMPELCTEAETETEKLDSDPNTVFIRDETGMAIPVAKVVQPHSTFGDPNFGQGPTGPRFPFNEVPHSPPVSHNPVGSCNFRPQLPFEPNQSVPIYSSHQQRTSHESVPFNSFDEMYQAQEMAGAAAGLRGKAGPAAWTNAYHNIHTEQPRACKFTYAYSNSNSSKENLSNSGCSNRSSSGSRRTSSDTREQSPVAAAVQILPETLVTGAVNVASSAINTARSVIDMLRPRHDEPLVAQWDPITPAMEAALRQLAEMGFNNRELNIMLLRQHKNDVARVISELVQ